MGACLRNSFWKTGTACGERWHVNSTTLEADEGRRRPRDIAGHEARSAPARHLPSVNGAPPQTLAEKGVIDSRSAEIKSRAEYLC